MGSPSWEVMRGAYMPTPDLCSLPGARATPLPRGSPKEELLGVGLMSEPRTLKEHHAQPSLPC